MVAIDKWQAVGGPRNCFTGARGASALKYAIYRALYVLGDGLTGGWADFGRRVSQFTPAAPVPNMSITGHQCVEIAYCLLARRHVREIARKTSDRRGLFR